MPFMVFTGNAMAGAFCDPILANASPIFLGIMGIPPLK